MKLLRIFLLVITTALCGCVYHEPFEQGNILRPSKIQAVRIGMTSAEVLALLGTPVLENIYNDNRMVYVYSKLSLHNKMTVTQFSVTFQQNHVVGIN